EGINDGSNFRSRVVVADLNSADPVHGHGTPIVHKIFSRWIPTGGRNFAQAMGSRVLSLYKDPPLEAVFRIDASRFVQTQLAKYFALDTDEVRNEVGETQRTVHAAIEVSMEGDEILVKAQQVGTISQGSGGGGEDPGGEEPGGERVIILENSINN